MNKKYIVYELKDASNFDLSYILRNNLNKLTNNEKIFDLPSRFNYDDVNENTFQIYDVQNILNYKNNQSIYSDYERIRKQFIDMPNNNSIINFNNYTTISIPMKDDNNSDVSHSYVRNSIGLRFNPDSNKLISEQWDHNNKNKVLCNTINYLNLSSGNILKRADVYNSNNQAYNQIYYVNEISSNGINIISKKLGNSISYLQDDTYLNSRNFNNLFPLFNKNSFSIESENLTNKIDDLIQSDYFYYNDLEAIKSSNIKSSKNYYKIALIKDLDLSFVTQDMSLNLKYNIDNYTYNKLDYGDASSVYYFEQIFETNSNILKLSKTIDSLDSYYCKNTNINRGISHINNRKDLRIYIIGKDASDQSFITAYYLNTSNNNNCIIYNIFDTSASLSNYFSYPYNNEDLSNNFNNNINFMEIKIFENHYTNLFIDEDEANVHDKINFYTKTKNSFRQEIIIPSFGVQQIENDKQGRLTQIDTINPRATNFLYGIFNEDIDASFLNPNFYNINFNEKSWFKPDMTIKKSRGINICNLYFSEDANGHMMYQYSISNKMSTDNNNLLDVDNSYIPYTLFCNIKNGIVEILPNDITEISGLTTHIMDSSNTVNQADSINNNLNEIFNDYKELSILISKFACIYFKNSEYKFISEISSNDFKYHQWDNSTNVIKQYDLSYGNPDASNTYYVIPYNRRFYRRIKNILSSEENLINRLNNQVLFDFFKHLNQFLLSYPDYVKNTTYIALKRNETELIENELNLPLPNIFSCDENNKQTNNATNKNKYCFIDGNDTSKMDFDTIIVGKETKFIFLKYDSRTFKSFNFESDNSSNLIFNNTDFPILKNIYLRRDNTDILYLKNNMFGDQSLNIIDFTGIKSKLLPKEPSNNIFSNMNCLTSIIINSNQRDNSFCQFYSPSPLFKNILIKNNNNNLTIINDISFSNDGSYVIMDIPHNTNILYPNIERINQA